MAMISPEQIFAAVLHKRVGKSVDDAKRLVVDLKCLCPNRLSRMSLWCWPLTDESATRMESELRDLLTKYCL